MDPFLAQVEETVTTNRLFNRGERILVAVSGGADSVGLLMALRALNPRWRAKLFVAHINHQLRGVEAREDEEFVRRLCHRLEIHCVVHRADVRGYARRHGLSLEAAGRELRYGLLERLAGKYSCQRIAVGHTANDNAETVLMNLIRGTGLSGLAGIPVQRGKVVRPLLECQRSAIEAFLQKRRISWRQDSSNECLDYRRNLLRHKLMPMLATINPQIIATLNRMARILRAENELLDEQARKALPIVITRSGPGYLLDIEQLRNYNIALSRRILKILMPGWEADSVEAALQLTAAPTGAKRVLNQSWLVRKEHDGLFLVPTATPVCPGDLSSTVKCDVPGKTIIPAMNLELETMVIECSGSLPREFAVENREHRWEGERTEYFDYSQVIGPLRIRCRQPGDRLVPFGSSAGGESRGKRLKEILINDKVPRRLRDELPVLCDSQGILWVIGSRRANRACVTPKTNRILAVTARELVNRVVAARCQNRREPVRIDS